MANISKDRGGRFSVDFGALWFVTEVFPKLFLIACVWSYWVWSNCTQCVKVNKTRGHHYYFVYLHLRKSCNLLKILKCPLSLTTQICFLWFTIFCVFFVHKACIYTSECEKWLKSLSLCHSICHSHLKYSIHKVSRTTEMPRLKSCLNLLLHQKNTSHSVVHQLWPYRVNLDHRKVLFLPLR